MKCIVRFTIVLATLAMLSTTSVNAETAVVVPLMKYGGDTNWINLNIYGTNVRNGATHETGFGQHSGINLPDSGSPAFEASFTIPPNFKPGSDITARILWHTSATNCNVDVRPNFLSVTRAGVAPILGPGATSGLTVEGDTIRAADSSESDISQEVVVTISSPSSGETLQPLDAINFGMYRSNGVNNTCSDDIIISGIMLSYETH
jgi:hypothetical protein